VHPTSVLFTRKPKSGWVIFNEMEETKKAQCVLPFLHIYELTFPTLHRIRIITEIEPEWLMEHGSAMSEGGRKVA
jgi:ATP-dependent RNA helicase DDX35